MKPGGVKYLTIMGLAFIIIGVFGAIYLINERAKITENGVATTAVITETKRKSNLGNRRHEYDVYAQYETNEGETITAKLQNSSGEIKVGKTVKIWYMKENPTVAYHNHVGHYIALGLTVIFAVGGVIMIVACRFEVSKERKRRM